MNIGLRLKKASKLNGQFVTLFFCKLGEEGMFSLK